MFFKNIKLNRAFTLIELLVVMSIATILMTAVIVKQKNWNDQLAVSTQAYEMALMFRQAQLYSLGVKKSPPPNGAEDSFNVGYGIFVSTNALNQYIFFVDRNQNFVMDGGAGGAEFISTVTFTKGVTVAKICGIHIGNGNEECSPDYQLAMTYVSFFRPEPKANISLLKSTGANVDPLIPPVKIYLKSPNNKCYYVKVEINGQISTGPVPVASQCL